MTHAQKVCAAKKGWSTKVKAEVHALGVMNHPKPEMRSKGPIHVYLCPECALWHLTSVSPEAWAKRQA